MRVRKRQSLAGDERTPKEARDSGGKGQLHHAAKTKAPRSQRASGEPADQEPPGEGHGSWIPPPGEPRRMSWVLHCEKRKLRDAKRVTQGLTALGTAGHKAGQVDRLSLVSTLV